MNKFFILFIFIISLSLNNLKAQNELTNLEIFFDLVDSAFSQVINENNINENVPAYFPAFESYPSLYTKLTSTFHTRRSVGSFNSADTLISFNIIEAEITYSKPFRKKFLGSYYIKRTFTLSGNYIYKSNGEIIKTGNFIKNTNNDVKLSHIKQYEVRSLLFTQSEIPAEPFWSNLMEPALALGTAAITVFLFFTVRSN